MNGWVKLHRQLMEKPIWLKSTPEQIKILMALLMMANHDEKKWEWGGQKFKVKAGQFVTSLESIASKCGKGVTPRSVRTALARFEKLEFLTNNASKHGRIITILNWETYQSKENEPVNASDNLQSKAGQRPVNSQSPNKNIKNDKNDKNEKKNNNTVGEPHKFVPPTTAEVEGLFKLKLEEKKLLGDPKHMAELFISHYTANGWMVGKNKMKSWQATVTGTWMGKVKDSQWKYKKELEQKKKEQQTIYKPSPNKIVAPADFFPNYNY